MALTRVARSLRTIEYHPESKLSLSALAREAGLSPYHFLRMFARLTGMTPHQYVLRSRLRKQPRDFWVNQQRFWISRSIVASETSQISIAPSGLSLASARGLTAIGFAKKLTIHVTQFHRFLWIILLEKRTKSEYNRCMPGQPKLTPIQVLERLQLRLEQRMESLQRVKLDGYHVVISELETELDLLRRAQRYLED